MGIRPNRKHLKLLAYLNEIGGTYHGRINDLLFKMGMTKDYNVTTYLKNNGLIGTDASGSRCTKVWITSEGTTYLTSEVEPTFSNQLDNPSGLLRLVLDLKDENKRLTKENDEFRGILQAIREALS